MFFFVFAHSVSQSHQLSTFPSLQKSREHSWTLIIITFSAKKSTTDASTKPLLSSSDLMRGCPLLRSEHMSSRRGGEG